MGAITFPANALFCHTVLEACPDAIVYVGMDGHVVLANRKAAALLHATRSNDLIGRHYSTFVRPDDITRATNDWNTVVRGGSLEDIEYQLVCADGGSVWTDISAARVIRAGDGVPDGVVGVMHDVTADRAHARAFRTLFAANPLPMWVLDAHTLRFLEVNDAAVAHYGYSRDEFLAMRVTDIRTEGDPTPLPFAGTLPRDGFRRAGVRRHRHRDGQVVEVELHSHETEVFGRPAVLTVAIDLTAQRRLEEQLRQSQKMEAVGRLAGGVAHDFNNILTVVLGYGELLLDNPELSPSLRSDVQQIQDGALMAASLTRQLLAFSRKQIVQPLDLDLNSALRRLRSMLERVIGEDVKVVMRLSKDTPVIRVDPGQLEQIVMNLAVNARDAMPHGGTLTIETGHVRLDREYAHRHMDVEPGDYVMLAVSDTGAGMPPDVRTRIFEPFFTTKPAGKGTGLGLPIVYGIVKQNDGTVWVYSEPGLGTTFKMYFPPRRHGAAARQAAVTSLRPVGSETILVVEDDASTLDLARKGLEKFGYAVLTARNGEAALDLADAYPSPIHLLLTDVIMPAMSGKELAAALAARRPGLKVLFSSGYTEDAIVHHGVLDAQTEFLQKPYTPEVLARRVRQILDAPPARN